MTVQQLRALAALLCILIFHTNCSKVDNDAPAPIKKESIKGLVQKGPYVNGTQIIMSELTSELTQTGKVFSTQITDNTGAFELKDLELTSNFVLFSANGFYYNEVSGSLSTAQLTLTALSDIADRNSINVNVLTELERKRVEKLVSADSSFNVAKAKAQREILQAFGIESEPLSSSENLSITGSSEGNAVLLAISVILQGNRQDAQLTELLATISNDLKEDGQLSTNSVREELRRTAVLLKPAEIRAKLEARYQELGATATIPDFEKYLTMFLNYSATSPSAVTQAATDITGRTAVLNGVVNPNSAATTVSFLYGETTNYSDSIIVTATPVSGKESIPFTTTLEDLKGLTIYHYRIKAQNSLGTSYGEDQEFTTIEQLPIVITESVTDVSFTSANASGKITAEGSNPILKRGFIWSRSPNQELNDNLFGDNIIDTFQDSSVVSGSGPEFAGLVKPMFSNMTFYVKAYALTKDGFGYGNEITITTQSYYVAGDGVTDVEGHSYPTVKIGTQEWMKTNLNTGKFSNGDSMSHTNNDLEWKDFNAKPYYFQLGDYGGKDTKAYNIYAVQDPRNVCPTGWHVPTQQDWETLEAYLGMPQQELLIENKYRGISEYVGDKMKSAQAGWDNTMGITNDAGFSAIPTSIIDEGIFTDRDYFATYWTADGSYRQISYASRGMYKGVKTETQGLTVRCVKD